MNLVIIQLNIREESLMEVEDFWNKINFFSGVSLKMNIVNMKLKNKRIYKNWISTILYKNEIY